MACKSKLHIVDVSKNNLTGRVTVEARITVEDNADGKAIEGAVEAWHIEALEIHSRYNGSVEDWLRYIGRVMLDRHLARTVIHSEVNSWKGQKIDIDG